MSIVANTKREYNKVLLSLPFLWGLMVSPLIHAAPNPDNFPKDFRYQNKPIDSLCIAKLTLDTMSRASSVNIDSCSRHPDYKFEKADEALLGKGFIGYEYSYNLPNTMTTSGMSYYRYIGKVDNAHLLYTMQNNGGSGFLTSIILVERLGNQLRLVKQIAAGDRCNGGVDPNVQLKDKKVTYKSSITPYDMLALSGVVAENVEAYNDIASCATCCIGDVQFEYDLNKENIIDPTLLSVSLSKEAGKDEVYTQGKLQTCFNKVLRDYLSKNKNVKFTQEQLQDFGNQFKGACINKK